MKSLRLLSWNVNGLRAAHKKGFVDWLTTEDPDIIGLQETKANQSQLPNELLSISGYKSFFSSAEKKGYSGVALYTKMEPHLVEYGIGIPEFDNEGRILICEYKEFILFNIYFPNGQSSKERLDYKMGFYDAFLKVVTTRYRKGQNIIICGDVNTAHRDIDIARPKANQHLSGFLPIERAWLDKLVNSGFIDTFRVFNNEPGHYTYWDMITRARERNVGWRIDYFFVNQNFLNKVQSAYILPDIMGSDHCPVGLDINIE